MSKRWFANAEKHLTILGSVLILGGGVIWGMAFGFDTLLHIDHCQLEGYESLALTLCLSAIAGLLCLAIAAFVAILRLLPEGRRALRVARRVVIAWLIAHVHTAKFLGFFILSALVGAVGLFVMDDLFHHHDQSPPVILVLFGFSLTIGGFISALASLIATIWSLFDRSSSSIV